MSDRIRAMSASVCKTSGSRGAASCARRANASASPRFPSHSAWAAFAVSTRPLLPRFTCQDYSTAARCGGPFAAGTHLVKGRGGPGEHVRRPVPEPSRGVLRALLRFDQMHELKRSPSHPFQTCLASVRPVVVPKQVVDLACVNL